MAQGELRELTRADLPAVQALFERAADYFVLHEQRQPAPDEAETEWASVPPDTPRDHKHVLGWFAPELAGVAEVVRDWPRPGTWVVGLLLLDPAARGSGAGTAIVGEIDARAARSGADRLRIAVILANTRGMRFWQRLGFAEVPVHASSEQTLSASIALERPVGQATAPG